MIQKYPFALTFAALLLVLVVTAVAVAISFPVVAKHPGQLYRGDVSDGFGKPIPGAILRFHDPSGRLVATVTADRLGQFQRTDLPKLIQDKIDGYALVRTLFSTGGPFRVNYLFVPTGRMVASFQDASGKAIPGLTVTLEPIKQSWFLPEHARFLYLTTHTRGKIALQNIPVNTQFDFKSADPHGVVSTMTTHRSPQGIRCIVTVVAPATMTGRLVSQNGSPLAGYCAFVTTNPNVDNGQGRTLIGMTGKNGRFRIPGLRPGTYYVSAQPPRHYHSIAAPQRVRVGPGQTHEVLLHAH